MNVLSLPVPDSTQVRRSDQNKPPGCEKLARLFRAGELTEIWTPDAAHEAMRDLIRGREAAVKDRTRKGQEIRSFLLRHGKIYLALAGGRQATIGRRTDGTGN